MNKLKSSVLAVCTMGILSTACLKVEVTDPFAGKSKSGSNHVSNKSSSVNQKIGDDKVKLQIISESVFKSQKLRGKILSVNSPEARMILDDLPHNKEAAESIAKPENIKNEEESLLLGFPIGLIGQQSIFGGVITKVSDKTNETLGGLKLTDLSPLHVRTLITAPGGAYALTLVGCAFDCEEDSEQGALINFPIVGVNEEAGMVILDLAPIGKELDLITMLDPTGAYTKLKAVSSATTAFDYDFSTLVFDIKTKMIPVTSQASDPNAPVTEFTVRWYLKLNSVFNPAFASRTPTEGVGFFTTERSKEPKITRFSTTNFGQSVKYYVKNVPKEYQKVFAGALDNWNKEFKKVIGRELLSYEFINADDERAPLLVPGDIRYNIIEWDLENKASYGGLGPSIANQFTGETLSANVLIQGPTIVELYSKWFSLSKDVRKLQNEGRTREANELMHKFNVQASKEIQKRSQTKFTVKLGKHLTMNVHSQQAELEDPMIKNHFEIVPEGMTFEEYMTGYFTEMLEHELGHNLGLRHNFKGNLGAYESDETGSVSRSIMEYLGRPYRHLNAIGLYDKMAISYGYKGIAPKHLDWFCTDEDQGYDVTSLTIKSAECTKADATSDPFSFWEGRLDRSIDLLIDTQSTSAPVWKLSEISSQVDEMIIGLTSYALSAEKTAASWTNFFGKADRPEDPKQIKAYVLERIKKKLCAPELTDIIAAKESADAQKLTEDNLNALKKAIEKKSSEFSLYTSQDISCE